MQGSQRIEGMRGVVKCAKNLGFRGSLMDADMAETIRLFTLRTSVHSVPLFYFFTLLLYRNIALYPAPVKQPICLLLLYTIGL
jgi:hypothetical protein